MHTHLNGRQIGLIAGAASAVLVAVALTTLMLIGAEPTRTPLGNLSLANSAPKPTAPILNGKQMFKF